jgi:predicted amidohydrolase YtcJ
MTKRIFPLTVLALILLTACTSSSATSDELPTQALSEQATSTQVSTPTQAPTAIPTAVTLSNVALNKPATASGSRPENPPAFAVDGNRSQSNFFSADFVAPQWIEIDLGDLYDIYELHLNVFQDPFGDSLHRVLGRAASSDEFQELHIFAGYTENGDILSVLPEGTWPAIRYIRIQTDELPTDAYVEWREIEVIALPSGTQLAEVDGDSPNIIYHNANIITMNPLQPSAQAIAIQGEHIQALGNNEDILALAVPGTQLIDLQGNTLMPGIVDPHTHLLKDMGGIDYGQSLALENGITTLVEMSAHPDFMNEISDFANEGNLRVRTSLYMAQVSFCGEPQGDWYLDYAPGEVLAERLRVAGVKIFADGGACNLPALSFEYPTVGGFGDLYFEQEEMNAIVQAVHNNGYQIAVHAQGDVAIEITQNAIEAALAGNLNGPRHRIEHNPFHRADLLPRYSEIGIVPTIVFGYATCAENQRNAYSNFFGFENLSWLENWRDFVDANPDLIISWHGDDPGIPPINPFLELYGVVTRNQVDEDGSVCEAPNWLAGHAITSAEALPMMTINAAYALFREDEVGSLEVGKFADMLVLSGDPLGDPLAIKDIAVWMTMIGGQTEYCADGQAAYCP